MSSNLKNDVCKLQNISYELSYGSTSSKKITIDSGNVLDCQITWDINDISVMGIIIFQDTSDMFSLAPPHASMTVTIKYKQYLSANNSGKAFDFEKAFSVTRIERGVKGSEKSTVKLEFIDPHYFYMSRRYISKGYKNIKFSDILKEVLNEDSSLPSAKLNSVETEVTHEALVIPANKSFVNFIYNREYMDGFNLINDRFGFNIVNATDYMELLKKFSKASSFKFTTSQENQNNPFYIKEYKFVLLDSFTFNTMLPNTIVSNFDYTNKGANEVLVMNDVVSADLKNGDTPLPGGTLTKGFKRFEYHTSNFSTFVSRLHSFKLLESHLLEITVAGNAMYNLYDIININISNPIDGITNVNLINSGNYVILKIVDKIEGTYFNQIITVGRVGIKYK